MASLWLSATSADADTNVGSCATNECIMIMIW